MPPLTGDFISGSEYSFYKNYNPAINNTEQEKTLYSILQQKVAFGGEQSLNRSGMNSVGVIYSSKGSMGGTIGAGTAENPHISSTLSEAQQWSGGHQLQPVSGRPGLYRDQSLAPASFVFVLEKSKTRPSETKVSNVTTYTPPVSTLKPPPPWGGPKSIRPDQPVKKKIPQEYDLLFNTLDYTKTYEQEIQKISMELISTGDDLLTNYTYESIDFLPDVDIEVKVQSGEYVNAKTIFEQTEKSDFLESIIDESETSEEIDIANELITYLESKISTTTPFSEVIKFYGSIDSSGKFSFGKPTENKVDFYLELPEKFRDLDIEIRFDRI